MSLDRLLPYSIYRCSIISFPSRSGKIKNVILMYESHEDVTYDIESVKEDKHVLLINSSKISEFLIFFCDEFKGRFFWEVEHGEEYENIQRGCKYQHSSLLTNMIQSIDRDVFYNYTSSTDDREFIKKYFLYNPVIIRLKNLFRFNCSDAFTKDAKKNLVANIPIKDLYVLFNMFFLKYLQYTSKISEKIELLYTEERFIDTDTLGDNIGEDDNVFDFDKHNLSTDSIGDIAGEIFLLLHSIKEFQNKKISRDCFSFILFNYFGIFYSTHFIKTLEETNFTQILFSFNHNDIFLVYSKIADAFLTNYTNAERNILLKIKYGCSDTFIYLAGGAHIETLKNLILEEYPTAELRSISTLDKGYSLLKFFTSTRLFETKTPKQKKDFLEKYTASFVYEKRPKVNPAVPYIFDSGAFSKHTKKLEDFKPPTPKEKKITRRNSAPGQGTIFSIQKPKQLSIKEQELLQINIELDTIRIKDFEHITEMNMVKTFIRITKYQFLVEEDINFLTKYFKYTESMRPKIIDLFYDIDLFKSIYCKHRKPKFNNQINKISMHDKTNRTWQMNTIPDRDLEKIQNVNMKLCEKYLEKIRVLNRFLILHKNKPSYDILGEVSTNTE